jgi:hypothetical protein
MRGEAAKNREDIKAAILDADYRKRARKAPCFSKGMQSASAAGGFE